MTDALAPRTKREAKVVRECVAKALYGATTMRPGEARSWAKDLFPDPLVDAPEPTLTEAEARERERAAAMVALSLTEGYLALSTRKKWVDDRYPSLTPPEPQPAPSGRVYRWRRWLGDPMPHNGPSQLVTTSLEHLDEWKVWRRGGVVPGDEAHVAALLQEAAK